MFLCQPVTGEPLIAIVWSSGPPPTAVTTTLPPLPISSTAFRSTSACITPTVITAWSAIWPWVRSQMYCEASSGSPVVNVAPNLPAISCLNGSGSTTTTCLAPAYAAPCTALMPTPPLPKITTVSPGLTPAAYTDEPQPVVTPQATSAAISKGKPSSIGTAEFSEITIRCENVPSTHMPPTSVPFSWKRNVPSRNIPVPAFTPSSHMFWCPVEQ